MAERPQVLVVDDEPNMRRVLAALLEREPCEVLQAADGAEALKVLEDNICACRTSTAWSCSSG
jgi:CheY-like chemotaxis protein